MVRIISHYKSPHMDFTAVLSLFRAHANLKTNKQTVDSFIRGYTEV